MPSTTRIGVVIRRSPVPSTYRSGFICLQCRRQASTAVREAAPATKTALPIRGHANTSWTDKIRNTVWGKSLPPKEEELRRRKLEMKNRERKEEVVGKPRTPGVKRYRPATTWKGLRTIGSPKVKLHGVRPFEGFMAPKKMEDLASIERATQRALVEVWTQNQAGHPLPLPASIEDPHDQHESSLASNTRFVPNGDGGMNLAFVNEQLEQDILESIFPTPLAEAAEDDIEVVIEEDNEEEDDEKDKEEDREPETLQDQSRRDTAEEKPDEDKSLFIDAERRVTDTHAKDGRDEEDLAGESAQEEKNFSSPVNEEPSLSAPVDESWRDVSFGSPDIKFAVVKRAMQLTGIRIPDPDIERVTNPTSLIDQLVKKPKPKKLQETLTMSENLAELPNLQMYAGRFSTRDKEAQIGRWKVIQAELQRNGLWREGDDTPWSARNGLRV